MKKTTGKNSLFQQSKGKSGIRGTIKSSSSMRSLTSILGGSKPQSEDNKKSFHSKKDDDFEEAPKQSFKKSQSGFEKPFKMGFQKKQEPPKNKKQAEEKIQVDHGKSFQQQRNVDGIIKCHPDGYGFLIPDDPKHPDVYISKQFMTGIMTNDRLRVLVHKTRDESRLSGEVVQILNRSVKKIVGKYLPVDVKYGVILDEQRHWGADLRIRSEDAMNAKEGDLVVVEITNYPGRNQDFTGKIISIIGDEEDPMNDIIRIVHSHHIPFEFSAQVRKEVSVWNPVVTEKDFANRKDLRQKNLITIDGATAKDFDDAVYAEQNPSGFKLWVAIADVSHYVKPGTALDEEAYARGTSVYFPNFVVPMLPEELSNELCSLKPKVNRLCFVCEMQIDFQGVITHFEFYEAVMESKARVTYGEAQEIIDGKTPSHLNHVEKNIKTCRDLAKILMAKRFREGSLDLELPETQVVVNEAGEAVDIIKSERLFAHRLIEELMLATNICTARFMDEKQIQGIYRIHEEPNEEKIAELQKFLWNFGHRKSLSGKGFLQQKLTKALESFHNKPEHQILSMLTLRSMSQAKYSSENKGHFGLGFSHYSHFTSPIRRYPDLIAHRLIKSVLYPQYSNCRLGEDELSTAGSMLSACEQRSVKAERQIIAIKKARFMQKFVGEKFEGVINSVARFGIFVNLRAFDVDGLVKLEELGRDRFIFDPEQLMLLGDRTRKKYRIGDNIEVFVAKVDIDAGKIDFKLKPIDDDEDFPQEELSFEERQKLNKLRRLEKKLKKKKGQERDSKERSEATGKPFKKRSKAEKDRRSLRKKRLSKRRGKN